MKSTDDLKASLISCPVVDFRGNGFRVIPGSTVIRSVPFDRLVFGRSAGRCNPSGVERLYASLDSSTARAEFDHYQRLGGLDPDLAESFQYGIEVEARVIDLQKPESLNALGLAASDLAADYAISPPFTFLQLLGDAIANGSASVAGILLPSVRRPAGVNLVVFRSRLAAGLGRVCSISDPMQHVP